ncbi:hypothetical protein [Thioclava pacifica]|uniref:Uncharacterized protein n=1 Tax=Thioclava pacifica DSM 10166 TaxID=1353537 RepID=A0A074J8A8_9RHOB|nr:hypothetical protein [Thioclava pacifica]KEO52809.1 hypothetical protein TP2_07665 [Thioclava pacifica DSM 10166]
MSATATPADTTSPVTFYIIAAIIVLGLVVGTALYGLLGLTVWMVVLTLAIFVILVGISIS